MKKFAGKVALITGASSGIGRATALAFAREGAQVVVASRRIVEGEETTQLVKDRGGEAMFVQTDVAKASEVEALVDKTVAMYGRLDIAFNNAGVQGALKKLIDITESDFEFIININLKGVLLSMKYEIIQMLKQGGGAIVNTSSSFGLLGAPAATLYAASKHGVEGITKSAALEYAKLGIRINSVSPGSIETPMINRFFTANPFSSSAEEARSEDIALHPLGRIGEPEEVAEAVVWLCSDQASFVTGHSLAVDGGYAIQ